MLSSLSIESLGLIDQYTFCFQSGFTSITGETGSGKTSLIEALKLALGKKSDFEFIKKGEKKASIKASFEMEPHHPIYNLLHEWGFDIENGELLIIARSLSSDGKSKALLNDQPISLSLLAKLSTYLCDFIDQDSLLEMRKEEQFLELLDKTGPYKSHLQEYSVLFAKYQTLQQELKILQKQLVGKDFKQSAIEEEIKELKNAAILPDEEETLFQKYKKAQVIQGQLLSFESHIGSLNQQILPILRKMKIDKCLNDEDKDLIETAYVNLCDVSSHLESVIEDGQFSVQELLKMEDRLKLIHTLKRKYQTESHLFDDILNQKEIELHRLFTLDEHLEKTLKDFEECLDIVTKKAAELAEVRKQWAVSFQEHIQNNLRPLNMPFAELEFTFIDTPLNEHGNQKVDILLKANAASNKVPIHQGASGGELARINFCFFLETSKMHFAQTYVFDEIDASVGGVTSSLMGDKLKELSLNKQVFCITHFPQMAQKAQSHLVFEKKQEENRTTVNIMYSNNGPIGCEIERMIGVKE